MRSTGWRPTRFDLVVAVLLSAVVFAAVAVALAGPAGDPPREAAAPGPASTAGSDAIEALGVLHRWDAARARAWSTQDRTRLQSLYVPGSAAGAADLRLLARWSARGVRVGALRTQVFSVRVLEHSPDRWRLRVADRVSHAVAVRGHLRQPLPRDGADLRTVTMLRDSGDRWRVAAASPVG